MLINSLITHQDDSKRKHYLFGIWRWLLKEDRKICLGERKELEFNELGKNT